MLLSNWEIVHFWANFIYVIAMACTLLATVVILYSNNQIRKADKIKNDILEKENLALQKSLEVEKIERLKLEKDISPRQINNRGELITKLSKYQDMTVIVQSIQEIEAMRFAERISSTFRDAHWKVIQQPADVFLPFIDGVWVEHEIGAFLNVREMNEITDMIVDHFRKSDIEAVPSPSQHPATNTITIKVGFKPPIKEKGFKIIVIDSKENSLPLLGSIR